MRFRKKWIEIPQLHQKNPKNKNSAAWCGRTSASMIHNYYKMLAGEADALISNQVNAPQMADSVYDTKRNLFYPAAPGATAQIAAPDWNLFEPLERIDGANSWTRPELYPVAGREAGTALSNESIAEILAPIFTSIDNNNPLIFYSSISMGRLDADVGPGIQHTRHIIVISGYELDDQGDIWLHIDDTVTMSELPGEDNDKIDFFGSANLRILDAGESLTRGARYWLRARRLFEKNQRSEDADDLWCDHSDRKGFAVILNKDRATPNTRAHETTAYVFPVGTNNTCLPSNVIQLHRTVEHQSQGGFFPIGANSIWHGGVHLPSAGGGAVRACADGELVAARLAPEEEQALGHFGSINFVLLKHEVTGDFLNHVHNRQQLTGLKVLEKRHLRAAASTQAESLAMLEKGDELSLVDTEEVDDGQYRWAHVKVDTSAVAERVGLEGYVAQGSEFFAPRTQVVEVFAKDAVYPWYSLYMHLHHEPLVASNSRLRELKWLMRPVTLVKSGLNLRQAPQTTDASNILGVLAAGDRLERLPPPEGGTVPGGWARVRVLTASNAALAGQEGFVASSYIQDAQEPEPELLDALCGGNVARLSKKVRASEVLWWAGTAGSEQCGQPTTIHWEIFSEDQLLPSWRTAEDDGEDLAIDSQSILSLVEQDGWGDNDLLSPTEVARFYARDADAPQLRTCACRFLSEWAVDLDKAISALSTRWWTAGLKGRLEPYQWWKEAEAAGVPLPPSPHVWHYNPISLLAAFSRFGGEGCPGEIIDFQDWLQRHASTKSLWLPDLPTPSSTAAPGAPQGGSTPAPELTGSSGS
ncbi:MAG: SH3 domain-containing protein [Myxococcaceae bacterium]|nr:SH3 domain-containing protein [Myxococcaceae bacterium]